MTWLLLATGFTGAWTLVFLVRRLHCWWAKPTAIAAYFSPSGGCLDAIVGEIKQARREILVQAYVFTVDPVTYGLIEARKRGLDVDILLDRSNEKVPHSDLGILLEHGLKPLIDSEHAIAHNKVLIIDRRVLITGSFNLTRSAEDQNAENLVVVRNCPELIRAYYQNFLKHKAHCRPAQRDPGLHRHSYSRAA